MSLPVPALRGTERGICFMDNGLVEKMLNKSGKEKILIVLLIGVLLLVIAIPVKSDKTGGCVSGSDTYKTSDEEISDYDVYMEQRIEKILSQVEGVGKVNVMVTLENTDDTAIGGVVIVAQGGDNGSVVSNITSALEALLGIPVHKIKVLKMS